MSRMNSEENQAMEILIVEDNISDIKFLTEILKNAGYTVRPAVNGELALRSLKTKIPDIILLDMRLPDIDGIEICRLLKKDPNTDNIPIIFISAEDTTVLKLKAMSLGAVDYINKPFEPSEILVRIKIHLDIHMLNRKLKTEIKVRKKLEKTLKESEKAKDIIKDQKKDLENKVQEGRDKFFSVIETTSNAIIISDQSGNITLWNNGAENIFGYKSNEIIGKPISKIIPEQYRLQHDKGMLQFVITGKGKHKGEIIELEGLRKDGLIFPLELSLSNWRTKGKKYFAAIIRDISDRRKAINALNKANTIINRSPAVAFLWKNSENWPVEFVSDNVKKVLGYSSWDFLKGKISYSDIIHPEDLEKVEEEVILNSKDKKVTGFIHKPYRIITKDGKMKWIDDRTNILRDKSGNITHYQRIILNITKHIQTEKTLKDAQSVLIHQEKMASLGGLAAGIAHEINNPLGFVMSNFRTLKNYMETIKKYLSLKENIPEKSALKNKTDYILEDIDDLFNESTEGFDRISLIVNNMRQFSRVDNDDNKILINLNELIKNTLVIAKNSYKYVAEVETYLSELPDINCRSSEINQVLLNIIVNAAQAIQQQKRKKMGSIKIKTYIEEDMLCCSIEDDGPGVPQKYIKKIFDPFFTTKGIGKGTGLGLSISYDIIVNKHKGELIVETGKESGTIFIIKIPINIIKESAED